MLVFKSVLVFVFGTSVALANYGNNHEWGYKADIYHPPSKYGHGGHYGGGHSHVEVYHSKPMKHYYNHAPMYHKKEYHHEDYYHQPKHYEHYEKPMEYYKPMYKEPNYYKPPPPPPKKEDDHMDMKFNVEIPLKKMFDSVMKKGDDEKKPMMGYGGGYDAYKPEPKEEKKEFEIKIPKIDIDGILDKMHDKESEKDEYKKA